MAFSGFPPGFPPSGFNPSDWPECSSSPTACPTSFGPPPSSPPTSAPTSTSSSNSGTSTSTTGTSATGTGTSSSHTSTDSTTQSITSSPSPTSSISTTSSSTSSAVSTANDTSANLSSIGGHNTRAVMGGAIAGCLLGAIILISVIWILLRRRARPQRHYDTAASPMALTQEFQPASLSRKNIIPNPPSDEVPLDSRVRGGGGVEQGVRVGPTSVHGSRRGDPDDQEGETVGIRSELEDLRRQVALLQVQHLTTGVDELEPPSYTASAE